MASGLQIWDENGITIMDTSTQIGRYLALINIGTSTSGSISVSYLDQGNPFAIPIMDATTNSSTYTSVSLPRVTFSGTTLSWQRQVPSLGAVPQASLLVGIY